MYPDSGVSQAVNSQVGAATGLSTCQKLLCPPYLGKLEWSGLAGHRKRKVHIYVIMMGNCPVSDKRKALSYGVRRWIAGWTKLLEVYMFTLRHIKHMFMCLCV